MLWQLEVHQPHHCVLRWRDLHAASVRVPVGHLTTKGVRSEVGIAVDLGFIVPGTQGSTGVATIVPLGIVGYEKTKALMIDP